MALSTAFIAALDVGTTSVRCFIIDERCDIKGQAQQLVNLLNPQPGYFEIEPEALWEQIVTVINDAVKAAGLTPQQLTCLTICTQRCTFLTWNHRTQEYYHNFITWKDLRADALVDEWNAGCSMRSLNGISYAIYLLTRQKRFLAGSMLKMMNGQVTPRFMYELQRNVRMQAALKAGKARIELLDSWILYKLRSGNGAKPQVEHITDITSATATGLFDPFTQGWSQLMKLLFSFDLRLLPKIVDNAYKDFGYIHPDCLGGAWHRTHIPIACSLSDQAASMWGSHCFNEGDVKITIGTGAFLNLITGGTCQAFATDMYPLVAWQFQRSSCALEKSHTETVFCVEGAAHDMGTIVCWAQTCGLFGDVSETTALAESVPHTGGVYFIPAFSGLGPPVNDHKAATGFIGITPSTTRAHLVRAILESIVYRLVHLVQITQQESKQALRLLRVDGGVSRNDFVCQLLADATGIAVERAKNSEASVLGAAYMAGHNVGLWPNMTTIRDFRQVGRLFEPRPAAVSEPQVLQQRMAEWCRAIKRFGQWY